MTTATYDTTQVTHLMNQDPAEVTEDDTLSLPVPDNAEYASYEITELSFWVDRLAVIYQGDDLQDGWEQLMFGATADEHGIIHLTRTPPGIMNPTDARNNDSPGANESEALYDLFDTIGIKYDQL